MGTIFDRGGQTAANSGSTEVKSSTPDASTQETPPVEAPATDDQPVEQPVTTDQEQNADATETAPALVFPDFTIARAAPDGLVVIVGTADASDTIVVKSNGQILGKTKPENSGEWVFVPENPLPTGGVEITVEAHDAAGEIKIAKKSEIVLIHEGRDQEPIVIASVPGEASQIIQGLSANAEVETAEVTTQEVTEVAEAVVESVSEATESATEEPAPSNSNDSTNSASTATEPVPTNDAPSAEAEVEQVTEVAETNVELVAEEVIEEAAENASTDNQPVTTPAATAQASGEQTTQVETEVAEVASEGETETASTEQPAASDAPAVVAETETQVASAETVMKAIEAFVQPSIDAIEIDGTMNFIAGAGPTGAIMRIYVDNAHIGDAVVEDGRWLLETANVLKTGSQRVRADLIDVDSTQVSARAEVNFVLEALPVAEAEVKTADADQAETSQAETSEVTEKTDATETTTGGETVVAATPAITPPADADSAPASTDQPATPELKLESDTATTSGEATTEVALAAQAETAQPEPAVESSSESAVSTSTDANAETALAAEDATTEVEPAVDTLTATVIGEGDDQRFVSGKAIIRRGDNLWTIARRVYGSGVKFTTIYEANSKQITNPHLIFPGQVFELPEVAE